MTAEPAAKLTPQEYLAQERQAEDKSEYLNGELFAMAGALSCPPSAVHWHWQKCMRK